MTSVSLDHFTFRVGVDRRTSLATAALVVGLSLFGSGAAGLANQVVWQRALKVYLGGSESSCSMIVVLVFMAGLGIGSIWMGNRTRWMANPMRTFGLLETVLGLVNLAVCGLLSLDLSETVFHVQGLAVAIGIPLLVIYALFAFAILMVPCLLMGATMPLAAESCQRNLGFRDPKWIGLLLFVNTLGSVAGTLIASGSMIAHLGLKMSLLSAAAMNVVAGLLLLGLARSRPSSSVAIGRQPVTTTQQQTSRLKTYNFLALGLGFCSLGFEMALFRLMPLRHQPLPFTFAAVLGGFLFFWSLGAALSSRSSCVKIAAPMRLCALTVLATLLMFWHDTPLAIHDTASLATFIFWKMPYFFPCLLFGYLFGMVTRGAAHNWGQDLGRIYGWNTAGSCLGVLAVTFIGYQLPFFLMVAILALLLWALAGLAGRIDTPASGYRMRSWAVPIAASGLIAIAAMIFDFKKVLPGHTMYSGRDGVLQIDKQGNLFWDGLWHSKLSQNNDHLGTNNWYLAVAPALCHPTGQFKDVCVIGIATGITASTLALHEEVQQVDGYDVSPTLEKVYRDFPEGTLHLQQNSKINITWQDARTGLALNPKQYDIIQTQPLYLKQAGSGLLNSVEFFDLVSQRLKPGGIFCLYSNGTAEQAFAIRETADQVFPYRETFRDGYLVILSNDPLELSEEFFDERIKQTGKLWEQIRSHAETADGVAVMRLLDRPAFPSGNGRLLVTDDRPIVEYPHYLTDAIQQSGNRHRLPAPTQGRSHE